MAEDAQGNVTPGFSGSETVAIVANPGGSTLGGTLTVAASNSVAVFSGLTLNLAGSGYMLAVGSGTLSSATTSSISVGRPAPPRTHWPRRSRRRRWQRASVLASP